MKNTISIKRKGWYLSMVNTIATVALSLAAMLPAQGFKEAIKPPVIDGDSVIIKCLPHRERQVDGDYTVEETENKDASARYEELKKALDERFAHMFELKAKLEKQQAEMSKKWDEYYILHEKYNHELKKIVAAWVTEENYL